LVAADGLSATALASNAVPVLNACCQQLKGWKIAPVILAEQARVAIGDDIAEALGARMVAIFIGERPGLSSPDSLGIYISWAPTSGRSTPYDAARALQDIPVAITSLSAGTLGDAGITSTGELSALTPGRNFTAATGSSAPFLRGVGNNNVGPGAESSVATYVDGIYYASVSTTVFSLIGVQQIDVTVGGCVRTLFVAY
jgi:hypothetical protein